MGTALVKYEIIIIIIITRRIDRHIGRTWPGKKRGQVQSLELAYDTIHAVGDTYLRMLYEMPFFVHSLSHSSKYPVTLTEQTKRSTTSKRD